MNHEPNDDDVKRISFHEKSIGSNGAKILNDEYELRQWLAWNRFYGFGWDFIRPREISGKDLIADFSFRFAEFRRKRCFWDLFTRRNFKTSSSAAWKETSFSVSDIPTSRPRSLRNCWRRSDPRKACFRISSALDVKMAIECRCESLSSSIVTFVSYEVMATQNKSNNRRQSLQISNRSTIASAESRLSESFGR